MSDTGEVVGNVNDERIVFYLDTPVAVHHEEDTVTMHYSGRQIWQRHGKLHREDGPAVEWPDGLKEWWLHVDLSIMG